MLHLLQTFARECPGQGFLGIPNWYKYLETELRSEAPRICEVNFQLMRGGKFSGSDILLIGLGVIDILLRIAAYVALAFVLYGSIKYITSQGSPDATKSAQNTILNALVGLAIAIVASAVVAFLGNRITQ